MKCLPSLLAGCFLTLSFTSHAGTDAFKKSVVEPEDPTFLNNFVVESSYVGESDFDGANSKLDAQDAFQFYARYTHRILLNGNWYFKLGAVYERFDFGSSDAPVPNQLQSIAGIVGVEYVVSDETGFILEARPGVYFSEDISSDTFDVPVNLALVHTVVEDKLFLIGGAIFSSFREYPVLPIAGVFWRISPEWDLKAYLPEPRLIYKPTDELHFWVGGEILGGSYRTDDRDVHPEELSGELVSYSDYRAGAGIIYAGWAPFKVDIGAGYSFERTFDYHNTDFKYSTEGAPYFKLKLSASF